MSQKDSALPCGARIACQGCHGLNSTATGRGGSVELMWNPLITYKAALWIISDSEIPAYKQQGFAGKISVNPNSGIFFFLI